MSKLRFSRPDWLELLLVAAAVALLFQLFPPLWWILIIWLDPRGWSRATWLALNVLIVFVLFGVKLGPGLYEDYLTQRAEKHSKRPRKAHGIDTFRDSRLNSSLGETRPHDDDYQARLRRDAEWRERALTSQMP